MTSDPSCQVNGICGIERGPGHNGETHRERRSLGRRGRGEGEKAGQRRDCGELSLSHPGGLAVFTELSVTW